MKKLIFLCLALSLQLVACTNADDDVSPNSSNNGGNNANTPQGDWKVTYFWDKDKEETAKFSGHSFVFQGDGTLVATANGSNYSGTWSKNSSGSRLNISISGTDALDELTDDWRLDEMTGSSIKLRDDNTEHLEEIYFEKQ